MRARRILLHIFSGLLLMVTAVASAQPTFTKAFAPSTIGPGSTSVLTFTIDNSAGGAATDLAFTDVLPAGVTLAAAANPVSTCGGATSAPNGGSTISFSSGSVGASGVCTVRVNVTSSTVGIHMNVSGDLTSTAGNSGTASADLTVATDRPGFTKIFSPSTVSLGGRSTLTFTIDNSANGSLLSNLSFTDNLPAGLVVASPNNASSTCSASTITANPGSSTVSLTGAFLAANSTCSVIVDVTAVAAGDFGNLSEELQVNSSSLGGRASATLSATAGELVLIKEFTDDPVPPGSTVNLEFTILNRNRNFAATGITFTDDLNATLAGLSAVGLPLVNPCGAGSSLTGTTSLALTGGNVPAEGSCTFSVALQVPPAATAGSYPNTTSTISGTVDGTPVVAAGASDVLFVAPIPTFTKAFLDDPVAAGGSTRLEFTITNTSATSMATNIAFIDELTTFLPFPISATLPAPGFCGGGATMSLVSVGVGGQGLSMTGGSLAVLGSCTFEVTVNMPNDLASGTYTNVSEEITATVDGATRTGSPATAQFDVVGGPRLTKEFTNDPVAPGDTVSLQFALLHDVNAPADATGITFTDDLDAALTGLVATGLPLNDVCGAGSQISGTTPLSFTGGTLAPGSSCQFSVTLQVPPGATPAFYTNTTSEVSSIVSGLAVTTPTASDDLLVSGLTLAKEFTDDPVIPGGQVNLQFTLTNAAGAPAASSIFFQDDLGATLTGMTVDPGSVPATPCGAGSTISLFSGDSFLVFSGGSLASGDMCQFSVTLNVPGGALSNSYPNVTQSFSADFGGGAVPLRNANDTLLVAGDVLSLTKTFLNNPVGPGATLDLEFELTNLSLSGAATGIAFTDDLGAALTGLQAITLPANGFCGPASTISGTGVLTIAGAELTSGASCTFTVTVQVPAMPAASSASNVTSQVTGTIGGLGVTGDPAADTLLIQDLNFAKSFAGPVGAGGTVVLTFNVDNLGSNAANDLGFTDDLAAVLSGMVATGLPRVDVCGSGSTLSGTSVLTLSGGSLGAGASCTFNVTLQLPAGAAAGSYLNTTSDLSDGGLTVANPATATLVVEPPPLFAKLFAPATVGVGVTSTLTFTIDNSAATIAASSLDFTDNLPAGMVVATPSGAASTCTGGVITAVSGTGTISYTGGTAGAGASCTVVVDVTSAVPGSYVNTTGDLTSSLGNSGTATDTLNVDPAPIFTKVFSPDTVDLSEVTTLTFTIDNTASPSAATALSFNDVMPAGMVVANPANVTNTCGGVVTATSGSNTINLSGGTVGANSTCTISVNVLSTTSGSSVNTVTLTSSAGASPAPASAPLMVGFLAIPTLSEWMLLVLSILLASVAVRRIGLG